MVAGVSDYNSKRDRHRLLALDVQLAQIDDAVLSQATKQRVRETAHAYALWLEADDALAELGIDVAIGGGIEFPNADDQNIGVGVVRIESIKIVIDTVKSVELHIETEP
jgi:hypothetical protein